MEAESDDVAPLLPLTREGKLLPLRFFAVHAPDEDPNGENTGASADVRFAPFRVYSTSLCLSVCYFHLQLLLAADATQLASALCVLSPLFGSPKA